MSWKGIKTQFIKDRMKETAWEDRGYINDLASIEQTILSGGPKSSIAAQMHRSRKCKYPIEAECIVREIEDGIYVPPEEFHQREAKRRHEEAIIEQHEKRKRKAREEADRRLWLVLGGRP
jgi:hypothetical protein